MKGSFILKCMSSLVSRNKTNVFLMALTCIMVGCNNHSLSLVEQLMESDIEKASVLHVT